MRISISAHYALSTCVAVAMLAGCSNQESQLLPSGAMQQNRARPSLSTHGAANLTTFVGDRFAGLIRTSRTGTETLTATRARYFCQFVGLRYYMFFDASGTAAGPYPGSFDDIIQAPVPNCPRFQHSQTAFEEQFHITSGAWFISDATPPVFSATYSCSNFVCSLGPASGWTYAAQFIRHAKLIKTRNGRGSESGQSKSSFVETLYSL